MKHHIVRVWTGGSSVPKSEQLAWKIAEVASDPVPVTPQVVDTVIDRVIDAAGVAIAAVNQPAVASARAQALSRARPAGATLLGVSNTAKFDVEWATWANTAAVRQLDMNDTFLAADYAHPSDCIPALIAVAQRCSRNGTDLLRGIVAAYEIHIALAKSICLHKHKKDHVAHLGPAVVAGIGALLDLESDAVYQAVQSIVNISFASRQVRRGLISSWKAFAPAHVCKLAIESVDRTMRGELSPSPIYEGEDGVISAMLGGPSAEYEVALPAAGETRLAILESFSKGHSAEYHAQVLIDLAFIIRKKVASLRSIETITLFTSAHTHKVIGTGSGDPYKSDANASRETLDHNAMYIFAVALEDGTWHHEKSYMASRASRESTRELWKRIITKEDPELTSRYHERDPSKRAFGARAVITLTGGRVVTEQLEVPNAHPLGARPLTRDGYIRRLHSLSEDVISPEERERFLTLAEQLPDLCPAELSRLNLQASKPLAKPTRGDGVL